MNVETFAILGALAFALSAIAQRRAVIKVPNAATGVLISVPISAPFFLIILAATGQISSIASFSWQNYVWLAAAGVVHFVVGRSLSYSCVQLVGVNIANILRRIGPLISVILGISLLAEPVSWQLIVGVLLIIGGVLATSFDPKVFRGKQSITSGISRKAIFLGLGAGLAWGTTPIMVKLGLGDSGAPAAGALISFLAATTVLSMSLLNKNRRTELFSMNKRAIAFFCLCGLLSGTAQLLKYIALSKAPASVIIPLFEISPVFGLILAFLINRKLEVFSPIIVMATIGVVLGAILLL